MLPAPIRAQGSFDVWEAAAGFVSDDKGVESAADALAGARDIIAEWVSEDARARSELRRLFERQGVLAVRGEILLRFNKQTVLVKNDWEEK